MVNNKKNYRNSKTGEWNFKSDAELYDYINGLLEYREMENYAFNLANEVAKHSRPSAPVVYDIVRPMIEFIDSLEEEFYGYQIVDYICSKTDLDVDTVKEVTSIAFQMMLDDDNICMIEAEEE